MGVLIGGILIAIAALAGRKPPGGCAGCGGRQ